MDLWMFVIFGYKEMLNHFSVFFLNVYYKKTIIDSLCMRSRIHHSLMVSDPVSWVTGTSRKKVVQTKMGGKIRSFMDHALREWKPYDIVSRMFFFHGRIMIRLLCGTVGHGGIRIELIRGAIRSPPKGAADPTTCPLCARDRRRHRQGTAPQQDHDRFHTKDRHDLRITITPLDVEHHAAEKIIKIQNDPALLYATLYMILTNLPRPILVENFQIGSNKWVSTLNQHTFSVWPQFIQELMNVSTNNVGGNGLRRLPFGIRGVFPGNQQEIQEIRTMIKQSVMI